VRAGVDRLRGRLGQIERPPRRMLLALLWAPATLILLVGMAVGPSLAMHDLPEAALGGAILAALLVALELVAYLWARRRPG
jgi:hypothetical protein